MSQPVDAISTEQSEQPQPATSNNLPLQPTPLIGRKQEAERICRSLLSPDVRLLTLTGPPGVGKTRLSLHVASSLLGSFPDGVFFVNLAPISDPGLVASEIARNLDVREVGSQSSLENLKAFLRDKKMLLVLDNFEQVVGAASLIADLLQSVRYSRVLVTSRVRLHVRSEHEMQVPPLSLPDLSHLPPTDRLIEYEAVKLFVQRAAAMKQNFEVTDANAPAVAEICCRLDGLPLAIELAAARIKILPAQSMALRLQGTLQLLTGGAHDLPARHQTLRGAIEWSHELLNTSERMLFRRLSVFVGGCSLRAIEQIVSPEADALDVIGSLVDKSLVKQEEVNGEPRFTMLETIHEYSREKLEESGEAPAIRRLHADYFLSLVELGASALSSAGDVAWLELLEVEHDNLRATLSWLLDQGEPEKIALISSALKRFWLIHGHLVEGRRLLEAVLAQSSRLTPDLRAEVTGDAGFLAWRHGDLPLARSLLEKALVLRRQIGDEQLIGRGLDGLGMLAAHDGDTPRAIELFTESLAMARSAGDSLDVAVVLNHLGEMWRKQGDYRRAAALYNESLQLAREGEATWIVGMVSHNLGEIDLQNNDYQKASTLFEESIKAMRELGSEFGVAQALLGWAGLSVRLGMMERAGRLLGAEVAMRGQSGASLDPADRDEYEHSLGAVRERLGEVRFAKAWAEGQAMTLEQAVSYALQTPQSVPQMTTTREDLNGLTKREVEVAALIGQSKSNSEIAEVLVLSKRTVETHITNILSKLSFTSRGQIAAWVIKNSLVNYH